MGTRMTGAVIVAACLLTGVCKADDRFAYEHTQWLYVATDSEAIAYARFPGFLHFRELIAKKMRGAHEMTFERAEPIIYTLHLIGIHEQTTLYVGESWIGDGEVFADLNDEEFRWVLNAVEPRKGQGSSLAALDENIQKLLAAQNDTAWEPEP